MNAILDTVRRGAFREVATELAPLTAAERKELLPELKALRTELRGWGWEEWRTRGRISTALLVAGAGCHPGAAAAAGWIGARDLRMSRGPGDAPVLPAVLAALAGRDPDWLGDLAHRLAARASTGADDYPLIRELVALSGRPVPTDDPCVRGWAVHVHRHRELLRHLDREPAVDVLAPRLFELPELPGELLWSAEEDGPQHWPQALARLSVSDAVERPVIVDACVSRLLRGGRPQELKFFRAVLRALALTPEEESARIPDWMGMAADGTGPVAAHAQGVLGALAERGTLSEHDFAQTSGAVFFRSEKTLVRTQLTLLGRTVRARAKAGDAAAVATLLRAAGDAFGHADTGVQDRALKLVARHLPDVDAGVRQELAEAAALLGPAHRETAAGLFGSLLPEDGPEPGAEETLPPVPARRAVPGPPDSVGEFTADLVAVMDRDDRDPDRIAFERTLDALVRLAHTDRERLAEAMRETFAGQWWFGPDHDSRYVSRRMARVSAGLELLVATVADVVPTEVVRRIHRRSTGPGVCAVGGMCGVITARIAEAAWLIRTERPPLLLATPTWETGALDAEVLLERLREYQRLGADPGPVDFTQALLRVAPGTGGPVAREAALLGTEEGDRLAAWLEGTAPELPALTHPAPVDLSDPAGPQDAPEGTGEDPARGAESTGGGLLGLTARTARALTGRVRQRTAAQRALPGPFRWLAQRPDPAHTHSHSCAGWYLSLEQVAPLWTTALPHHREAVASWLRVFMEHLVDQYADRLDWQNMTSALARLAEGEGDGPAGPELHRAVALGLDAPDSGARLGAVDALLVLAARGQLDPVLLGGRLGTMFRNGALKPNRLADAARTAAATGAYTTTWAVLAAALPALLGAVPVARSLGEVLEVAADCAERSGP
ncbi:DUF6493 family protein, partial [Streptomyces clavuligerus]